MRSTGERTGRRTRALHIVGLNLAVIAVGFVALELSFGGWITPFGLNRLNVPRAVRWEYDVSPLYPWPGGRVRYTRDTAGLRGSYERVSDVDILTIGGSTTDQRYVDDGHTWQDEMETALRRAGRPAEVANAGIDGQSTFGHLVAMKEWFPSIYGLQPRYVVFYVGLNDFYRTAPGYNDTIVTDLPEKSLQRLWYEKSAFQNLVHRLRTNWEVRQAKIGHQGVDLSRVDWVETRRQSEYETWVGPTARAFGERIRELARLVHERDATPIFVSQPARYYRVIGGRLEGVPDAGQFQGRSLTGLDFLHVMEVFDRALADAAKDTSSLYFDMSSDTRGEWDDADFYDYAHMTPSGVAKVGRYLAGRLLAHEAATGAP